MWEFSVAQLAQGNLLSPSLLDPQNSWGEQKNTQHKEPTQPGLLSSCAGNAVLMFYTSEAAGKK